MSEPQRIETIKYRLRSLLFDLIKLAEDEILTDVSDETISNMIDSLVAFNEDAVRKFVRGQREHGGNITDRDLDKEIEQETIDLFWYNEARKWKANETKS